MLLLTLLLSAHASTLVGVEQNLSLSPDSLDTLKTRAINGTGGHLNGDIFTVQWDFTPIGVSSTIGGNGYATLYLPEGLEVVGASILDDTGREIAPAPPGLLADGWGVGAFGAVDGSLAQLNADTGVFFSTSPETAAFIQLVSPASYNAGEALDLFGVRWQSTYNAWDASMIKAFGSIYSPFTGQNGTGNTPFGYGSPVAGTQTWYQNAYSQNAGNPFPNGTGAGPWQRIQYAGSTIGSGFPAQDIGPLSPVHLPTNDGLPLSLNSPLPITTNAVRFALGQQSAGEAQHVQVQLRVVDVGLGGPREGCFFLYADSIAGIGTTDLGGRDNPWSVGAIRGAALDTCLHFEQSSVTNIAGPLSTIKSTIKLVNLGATPINDLALLHSTSGSNLSFLLASPTPDPIITRNDLVWSINKLRPGHEQRFTLTFETSDTPSDISLLKSTLRHPLYASRTPTANGLVRHIGLPQLNTQVVISPPEVLPDQTVTLLLILTNTGDLSTDPLTNVNLSIPPGFQLVPASPRIVSGPNCPIDQAAATPTQANDLLTWSRLDIPICVGDTLSLSLQLHSDLNAPPGSHDLLAYYTDYTYPSYEGAVHYTSLTNFLTVLPVQITLDSDNDGLSDDDELTLYGTDPNQGDTDGDGISDGDEVDLTSNPLNTDSDGDGIDDSSEIGDPLNPTDTDGDGVPNIIDDDDDDDGHLSLDEGTADPDGDGVPNYLDTDSDGDGAADRSESSEDGDGDGIPDYLDNQTNSAPLMAPTPPTDLGFGLGCRSIPQNPSPLWLSLVILAIKRRRSDLS